MQPPRPVREDVSLAGLTSLAVGGPARYLAETTDTQSIVELLAWAKIDRLPVLILGGGSNLLVADAGFDGLVLRVAGPAPGSLALDPRGDVLHVTAPAGMAWDILVERMVAEDLCGIECLSGIPGTVGAAPIQNIGAYGQQLADVAVAVQSVNRARGRSVLVAAADCGFGYRTSRFKGKQRHLITAVELRLTRGGTPNIAYAELAELLGDDRSLTTVRETVLAIRRAKSMLYDPEDANHRSAGSFFLNPIVTPKVADAVAACAAKEDPSAPAMPRYPAPGKRNKISAAWLIERAGFERGHIAGAAGLSTNHVLAIINRGGARAEEIVALAGEIRRRVHEQFRIELVPEPTFVGF